jgi:CHAT domain-containing protein
LASAKKYVIGFALLAAIIVVMIWQFPGNVTLAELQKQYLLAKTEVEKNAVIERLNKYYLNLTVPDSLRRRVEREVAARLDTTKIDAVAMAQDTNVYRLERHLQNLLQMAAMARARQEDKTFQKIINQVSELAKTVDAGSQNYYWTPFVEQVSRFTNAQARNWLKAQKAVSLASLYHDRDSTFSDAERFAALSLNFLQPTPDERLRLDIMQRLLWILQRYHGMQELCIGLAQKERTRAERIKYHLRANSLLWIEAEAYSKKGQPQAALDLYLRLFARAQKFKRIDRMQWLIEHSLIGQAEAYIDLGKFEEASNVCQELERLNLGEPEKMLNRFLQFNILFRTGYFDQAESKLNQALVLAEKLNDIANRIVCLNNFGTLRNLLTEYDVAFEYFSQAKALFKAHTPALDKRLLVLTNIAYSLIAKNDSVQFNQVIQEAGTYIHLAYSPYLEAHLLSRIGDWYQKAKQYSLAIKYYHQADSISYESGFLHAALYLRMERIKCLIDLLRFNEAKSLIAEVQAIGRGIKSERVIDACEAAAQIDYREGNISGAIESSQAMLDEIAAMSSRFNNPDRLIAYRQKIYDHLKNNVLYEIALKHHDAAFVKLDEAKAYVLKSRLLDGRAYNGNSAPAMASDFVKTRLSDKSLLLNYMLSRDTLYIFLQEPGKMQLVRKEIDKEILQQTAHAYRDSINKTQSLFQHYNPRHLRAHYAGTVALAQKLYQDLLGHPAIASRLPHIELLYIVPDEFLYEIPFSSLMTGGSAEAPIFLADHTAVLTLPSASLLAEENVGNGLHYDEPPQHKKALISVDERFPGASQFVARVKALFPLVEELTVQDSAMAKASVMAQLQKPHQLYIFVGHGQANTLHPNYGYIELSVKMSKASLPQRIHLTVADLKAVNWLGAEMVMLVGCETASGRLYRGSGISGLQQEFLALGAKNVLGNLWEVDATHAIPQAQEFLTTWATTSSLSRALQESQRKTVQTLLEHRYYQRPHPYFWGSSVLLTASAQ